LITELAIAGGLFFALNIFASYAFHRSARAYLKATRTFPILGPLVIGSLLVGSICAFLSILTAPDWWSLFNTAFMIPWFIAGMVFIALTEWGLPKPPRKIPGRLEMALKDATEGGIYGAASPSSGGYGGLLVLVAIILMPLFAPLIGGPVLLWYTWRVRSATGPADYIKRVPAPAPATAGTEAPEKKSWSEARKKKEAD